MSQPQVNLQQLHDDIIEYLTKRSRIMSCHKLHTWNEFTDLNNFQYADYSREDLQREFLQTVLPNIFTYNLTAIQRRKIEIFATHNGFTSTENGFKELPYMIHLPTEGIHYSTSKEDAKEHRLSCIIGGEEPIQIPTTDQKIKAWVSAVNSTDDELVFNRLLPDDEIKTRMAQSHENFKTTGTLPANLTTNISTKIIAYRNQSKHLSSRIEPYFKKV